MSEVHTHYWEHHFSMGPADEMFVSPEGIAWDECECGEYRDCPMPKEKTCHLNRTARRILNKKSEDEQRFPRPPKPWFWLRSTHWLQSDIYEYPLDYFTQMLGSTDQLKAVAAYIDWNLVAANQELAEIREEFSWKPWAVDRPFVNHDRIRDEIVDTLHFLGNILTALGIDDKEFWESYKKKQQLNIKRQQSGTYSAKKGGLAMGSEDG